MLLFGGLLGSTHSPVMDFNNSPNANIYTQIVEDKHVDSPNFSQVASLYFESTGNITVVEGEQSEQIVSFAHEVTMPGENRNNSNPGIAIPTEAIPEALLQRLPDTVLITENFKEKNFEVGITNIIRPEEEESLILEKLIQRTAGKQHMIKTLYQRYPTMPYDFHKTMTCFVTKKKRSTYTPTKVIVQKFSYRPTEWEVVEFYIELYKRLEEKRVLLEDSKPIAINEMGPGIVTGKLRRRLGNPARQPRYDFFGTGASLWYKGDEDMYLVYDSHCMSIPTDGGKPQYVVHPYLEGHYATPLYVRIMRDARKWTVAEQQAINAWELSAHTLEKELGNYVDQVRCEGFRGELWKEFDWSSIVKPHRSNNLLIRNGFSPQGYKYRENGKDIVISAHFLGTQVLLPAIWKGEILLDRMHFTNPQHKHVHLLDDLGTYWFPINCTDKEFEMYGGPLDKNVLFASEKYILWWNRFKEPLENVPLTSNNGLYYAIVIFGGFCALPFVSAHAPQPEKNSGFIFFMAMCFFLYFLKFAQGVVEPKIDKAIRKARFATNEMKEFPNPSKVYPMGFDQQNGQSSAVSNNTNWYPWMGAAGIAFATKEQWSGCFSAELVSQEFFRIFFDQVATFAIFLELGNSGKTNAQALHLSAWLIRDTTKSMGLAILNCMMNEDSDPGTINNGVRVWSEKGPQDWMGLLQDKWSNYQEIKSSPMFGSIKKLFCAIAISPLAKGKNAMEVDNILASFSPLLESAWNSATLIEAFLEAGLALAEVGMIYKDTGSLLAAIRHGESFTKYAEVAELEDIARVIKNGVFTGDSWALMRRIVLTDKELKSKLAGAKGIELRILENYLARLSAVQQIVTSKQIIGQQKMQPFVLTLAGGGGIGKTVVIRTFGKAICGVFGIEYCVGMMSETDKYDSNLDSTHTVVLYDDPGVTKPEYREEAVMSKMKRLNNSIFEAWIKADLVDKGKSFNMTQVGLVTTNSPSAGMLVEATNREAAIRRLGVKLQVSVKEKFAIKKGSEEKYWTLDKSKLNTSMYSTYEHLQFRTYECGADCIDDYKDPGPWMDYQAARRYVLDMAVIHRLQEQARMETMVNVPICATCKVEEDNCVCSHLMCARGMDPRKALPHYDRDVQLTHIEEQMRPLAVSEMASLEDNDENFYETIQEVHFTPFARSRVRGWYASFESFITRIYRFLFGEIAKHDPVLDMEAHVRSMPGGKELVQVLKTDPFYHSILKTVLAGTAFSLAVGLLPFSTFAYAVPLISLGGTTCKYAFDTWNRFGERIQANRYRYIITFGKYATVTVLVLLGLHYLRRNKNWKKHLTWFLGAEQLKQYNEVTTAEAGEGILTRKYEATQAPWKKAVLVPGKPSVKGGGKTLVDFVKDLELSHVHLDIYYCGEHENSLTTLPENIEKSSFFSGNGLFLRTGWLMFPNHYWGKPNDKRQRLFLKITRFIKVFLDGVETIQEQVRYEYVYNASTVRLASADISITVANTFSHLPDMTKYFPEEFTLGEGTLQVVFTRPSKNEERRQRYLESWSSICNSEEGACISMAYNFFGVGNCGAVIYHEGISGHGPRILGIHIASQTAGDGQKGHAIQLKKSILESMMDGNSDLPVLYCGESSRIGEEIRSTKIVLDEPHPKSAANFTKHGATFLGDVGKHMTPKNSVRKTPYFDLAQQLFPEPLLRPLPMMGNRSFQVVIGRTTGGSPQIDHSILRKARLDYMSIFPAVLRDLKEENYLVHGRGYTLHEALNGVVDNQYRSTLKMSTSAGFPYLTQKKNLFLQASDGTWTLPPDLMNGLRNLEENLKNGKTPGTIYSAREKAEALPLSKETNRVFAAGNVLTLINQIMALGPVVDMMTRYNVDFETAIGASAQSPQWHDIMEPLALGGRVLELDFTSYDMARHPDLRCTSANIIVDMAMGMGLSTDRKYLELIMSNIVFPLVEFNGSVIATDTFTPSGHLFTAHGNSIDNSLLMRCAYFTLFPNAEIGSYRTYVKTITLGDDGLHASNLDPLVWNPKNVAACLDSFGTAVTNAGSKDAISDFTPFSEASFLKRRTWYNPRLGFAVGALEPMAMMKPLFYYEKSKVVDERTQLQSTIESILYSAEAHEEAFYNEMAKRLEMLAISRNVIMKFPTYNEVLERIGTEYEKRPNPGFPVLYPWTYSFPVYSKNEMDGGDGHEVVGGEVHYTDVPDISYQEQLIGNTMEIVRPNTADPLHGALERPIHIGDYIVPIGMAWQSVVSPFQTLLEHPLIQGKLETAFSFRADVQIRMSITGSPMHGGCLGVYWTPLPEVVNFQDENTQIDRFRNLWCSERQHSYMMVGSEETMVEMTIPFLWFEPHMAYTKNYWTRLGNLHIHTIAPITHAQGDTSELLLIVHANLTNVVIKGITSTQSEMEVSGAISAASDILGAAKELANLPKLSTAMEVGSRALGAVAGVARALGYSRPENHGSHAMIPCSTGGLANADLDISIKSLSMFSYQNVSPDSRIIGGTSFDELTFDALQRKSIVKVINFDSSAAPGTVLQRWGVTPMLALVQGESCVLTSTGLIAAMFRRWNGTMHYKITPVKPLSVRGQVRVVYDQGSGDGITLHNTQNNILDLQNNTPLEITIHYGQPSSYLVTTNGWFWDPFETASMPSKHMRWNGQLSLVVHQKLRGTLSNAPVTCSFIIEAWMDQNMEFMDYDPSVLIKYRIPNLPIKAQQVRVNVSDSLIRTPGRTEAPVGTVDRPPLTEWEEYLQGDNRYDETQDLFPITRAPTQGCEPQTCTPMAPPVRNPTRVPTRAPVPKGTLSPVGKKVTNIPTVGPVSVPVPNIPPTDRGTNTVYDTRCGMYDAEYPWTCVEGEISPGGGIAIDKGTTLSYWAFGKLPVTLYCSNPSLFVGGTKTGFSVTYPAAPDEDTFQKVTVTRAQGVDIITRMRGPVPLGHKWRTVKPPQTHIVVNDWGDEFPVGTVGSTLTLPAMVCTNNRPQYDSKNAVSLWFDGTGAPWKYSNLNVSVPTSFNGLSIDSNLRLSTFPHLGEYSYCVPASTPENSGWVIGSPTDPKQLVLVHSGERIKSLRPLLRIPFIAGAEICDPGSITTVHEYLYSTQTSNIPNAYNLLRNCFIGARGGVNIVYRMRGDGNLTVSRGPSLYDPNNDAHLTRGFECITTKVNDSMIVKHPYYNHMLFFPMRNGEVSEQPTRSWSFENIGATTAVVSRFMFVSEDFSLGGFVGCPVLQPKGS